MRVLSSSGRSVGKVQVPKYRQRQEMWVQEKIRATSHFVPGARNGPGMKYPVDLGLMWVAWMEGWHLQYIPRVKEVEVVHKVENEVCLNKEKCFHGM